MKDLETRIARLEKARSLTKGLIVRIFGCLPEDGAKPGEVVTQRTTFGSIVLDPRSVEDAKTARD